MKLTQHNRNNPQHNEISTTETSHNTMKLAQHNGNKPQHNEISTAQQKQATTQWN